MSWTWRPTSRPGGPSSSFAADFSESYDAVYGVAPDAQRFRVVEELRKGTELPVVVVRNWTTELLELLER